VSLSYLQEQIRKRIQQFEADNAETAISVKIRPVSGCFHREHSRAAYAIIDEWLVQNRNIKLKFEEHESGPEIIAAINSITAVINFVVAIIQARFKGMEKGDRSDYPIELIIRRIERDNEYLEEVILRTNHLSPQLETEVKEAFQNSNLLSTKRTEKRKVRKS